MFTVKIINRMQDTVTLHTYEKLEIHRPSSYFFQERLAEMKEEDKRNPELVKAHDRYIAMLYNTIADTVFYVDEDDEVYITDFSGSTVDMIISPKYQ